MTKIYDSQIYAVFMEGISYELVLFSRKWSAKSSVA